MLGLLVRSGVSALLASECTFFRGAERRLAMATATQLERTVAEPPVAAVSERHGQYRCECGHVLRVFGGGRHRRYFELTDSRLDDPVMDRACPQCGRGLPRKNTR
jgi:Zn finger protein HypA/HybF involved in hydrogenase expression